MCSILLSRARRARSASIRSSALEVRRLDGDEQEVDRIGQALAAPGRA
jgi:hypothetical protein